MLECGAGYGAWSRLRASKGWTVSVIEPAETAANVLKREFHYVGADLSEVKVDSNFDEVVEAHVFEHVSDPAEHLMALAASLKPGGVIRLITPNANAWKCRLLGPLWLWVLTEHLQIASESGLRVLAMKSGLEVLACQSTTPPPEGYPGFVVGIVSWLKNQLKGRLTRGQSIPESSISQPVTAEVDSGPPLSGRKGRLSALFLLLARWSAVEARWLAPFERRMCLRKAGDELVLIARRPSGQSIR